jgi:hypothetical protein
VAQETVRASIAPASRVSAEQWQRQYEQVETRLGVTRRQYSSEKLVVFQDPEHYTTHTFTRPGHAAHPAWISREVIDEAGAIHVRQSGFFAGSEAAFDKLLKAFDSPGQNQHAGK